MQIELNNFVKEVLNAPCFGFIGTVDQSGHPVITRIFGYKHDSPLTTLTVYTFSKDAQRVKVALKKGDKITATTSNSTNFKTVQFKGRFISSYPVSDNEIKIIESFNEKQGEILAQMGIPQAVYANWKYTPSLAFEIEVSEIFDQTPKVNSGQKIN